LAVAIGVLGVLFGHVATSAGLHPSAAVLMSATTFAGSAQFAAVSVLAAGGTVAAAVSTATLVNARYAAMGAALAPALGGGLWNRVLLAQLVVDESWAVAYRGDGRFSRERLIGAGLVLYAVHVCSTAVGAIAGNILGDPAAWGLDAAFPALFLLLLWPHVQRREGLAAAVLAAAIALALTPVAPPGIPILAGASASLIGLRPR
jgi:4-azaleucine resistance transporter AzlC